MVLLLITMPMIIVLMISMTETLRQGEVMVVVMTIQLCKELFRFCWRFVHPTDERLKYSDICQEPSFVACALGIGVGEATQIFVFSFNQYFLFYFCRSTKFSRPLQCGRLTETRNMICSSRINPLLLVTSLGPQVWLGTSQWAPPIRTPYPVCRHQWTEKTHWTIIVDRHGNRYDCGHV